MPHLRPPPQLTGEPATAALHGVEPPVTVAYTASPTHLVLHAVAHPAALPLLLHAYPATGPDRLTHEQLTDLSVLRWYQASALAPGVVLTGTLGERTLTYDPLCCFDLTRAQPLRVQLTYDRTLRPLGADPPDWPTARAWLTDPNPIFRIAALRRLALDPAVDPTVAERAHRLALLSDSSGLRQFAGVHWSGFDPHVQVRADPAWLLAQLHDPLRIAAQLDLTAPPQPVWAQALTRRNARYAIAWIFGNLARATPSPWTTAALHTLRDHLLAALPTLDEARDACLIDLAHDELHPDPDRHFAFGTPDPVDLLAWLRFALLRHRLITDLGHTHTDAFAWMVRDAHLLLDRLHTPALTDRLHAPSPPRPPPAPLDTLPPWLYRAPDPSPAPPEAAPP